MEKIEELKLKKSWPRSGISRQIIMIQYLVLDIQMARRVAVQRHRLSRNAPTGAAELHSLTRISKHLHRQRVAVPEQPSISDGASCIFEVVSEEESVVLMLDGWSSLSQEELWKLYIEEAGWRKCRWPEKERNDKVLQRKYANRYRLMGNGIEDIYKTIPWYRGNRPHPNLLR